MPLMQPDNPHAQPLLGWKLTERTPSPNGRNASRKNIGMPHHVPATLPAPGESFIATFRRFHV